MTDPSSASGGAVQALEAVRPAADRLSTSRSARDNASDVAAVCAGVESALGALVGRAGLSGQPLVREARQRDLISLEQAHAALELFAVCDRLGVPGEELTTADLDVAREAYGSLARGFGAASGAPSEPSSPGAPPVAAPPAGAGGSATSARTAVAPGVATPAPSIAAVSDSAAADASAASPNAAPDHAPRRAPVLVLLLVVVALGGGAYYWFGPRRAPTALDAGVAAYTAGRRDSARASFARAAAADPHAALPHLYLGRMAREDGDYTTAGKELRTAIQLDPNGAAGERELGAFFLARGGTFTAQNRQDLAAQDYDAARRAYVRAIQIDGADTASQGYLACALTRLGRADEAATWLKRAGNGPWSSCTAAPAAPAAAPAPARP
ncbi:MAG TPA: tetratricopeptide repeat protein [Gemmatimonadaceae bacterium]|nr:tetratricopeptide repeat protein [Gemmatimonadaceae bacterium]